MNLYLAINQNAMRCILVALFLHHISWGQNEGRIGLKIHPNLSVGFFKENTSFDNQFAMRNFLTGLNLGASLNYQANRFIFEFSPDIHTNRTGIRFKSNDNNDFAILNIRTISFTNELRLGYRIFLSNKPYYEIFIFPSYAFSFIGIQKLSGSSQFENVISLNQNYPNLDFSWKTQSIGLGFKIRTEFRNGRKIDYGPSWKFDFVKYPLLGLKVVYIDNILNAEIKPTMSTLSFELIYYFKKKLSP